MKTRGSWVGVVKFVGVTGLVCGLLTGAAFLGARNRTRSTGTGLSQVAASQESKISASKANAKWNEAYGKLPLSFEENHGLTAREVRYVSHGSGYELFLTTQEAVLALRPADPRALFPRHHLALTRAEREAIIARQMTAIRLRLEGANPNPQTSGAERLPARVNYFIGNDPKDWHTDVPLYARVKYAGVYPGVDLVFYGNQRRLEYDFIVAPGADPKAIALKVDGARKLHANSRGDLVLGVAGGEVALQKPLVYQNVRGERREIASRYAIGSDHRVTFVVGSYDRSEPLIIDPVLNYSTYLGGSADDSGFAIAVDGSGNACIAGQTISTDFPSGTKNLGVTAPTGNVGVSFVAEIDPTGTKLLYSAYLAGKPSNTSNINEQAWGAAVDSTGKIYVTGQTYATDFPTTSTIAGFKQSPNAGNVNGTSYLVKIDPTVNGGGSLIYSTYIGGTDGTQSVGDIGQSVAVDANGIAYVAGYTDSTPSTTVTSLSNFPVVNGFQTVLNSALGNAFLAKIDTTKSGAASLLYSTYLGGTAANALTFLGFGDVAYGVAIDAASGNAYLAGVTPSTDFPTAGSVTAFQPNPPAGNTQGTAFVTQIDTTKSGGASLIYSTYLGGAAFDEARAIALGPNKVAYVTGDLGSNTFPTTTGAFDTIGSPTGNAFISLIDTGATGGGSATLKYSTYLGGSFGDTGYGIQVDAAGNAYVAGTTNSSDFPFPPKSSIVGGFEPTYPAGAKNVGFIAKLNPAGGGKTDLLYSTYFGGIGNASNGDQIRAIAIDSSSPPNIYVTGQTFSTAATFPVFPTTTAFQTTLNGNSDAFVAKLTPIATLGVTPTSLSFGTVLIPGPSAAQSVTLTNNTNAAIPFTSATFSGANAADFAVSANTCTGSIPSGATNTCTVSVTFKPSVVGAESAMLVLTDGDSTSPQNIALSGTGASPAPAVGLAPTSLTFGNQLLNTTSTAQTVTLTNTGTGALTISAIAASGDFAETSGATACPVSPATLAAGANCTISVTFKPTVAGARAGTLSITDNATGSPHTVPLTGTGINVTPDFGLTGPAGVQNVKLGQTLSFSVTVTGMGGFNSPVALACTGAPTLAVCTVTSPVTPPVAPPSTIQAQVTMTTTALAPPTGMPTPTAPPQQVVPLVLALMLLFSLVWVRRPRLRLAMATAVLTLMAITGCTGLKHQRTPKGPATLTITGTSGALTHNVQVQISVN
jgi:hypothetical protein